MFSKKLSGQTVAWILAIIIGIAFLLRLLYFDRITFAYDQARDVMESAAIWMNDPVKIVGPTTDIKGVFHGSLYWYIISPFTYLSGQNPAAARLVMVLISLVNIVFIYYFAHKLFKNQFVALISALLFAVSFEAVQYGRWLSNPPPALLSISLFFYGFWLCYERKTIGLAIMFFAWALSANFQFFLLYHGLFFLIAAVMLFVRNKNQIIRFDKNHLTLYGLGALVFAPFIVSELKFKFQATKAILRFLSKTDGSSSNFAERGYRFVNSLVLNVGNTFTSQEYVLSQLILVVIVLGTIVFMVTRPTVRLQLLLLLVWFVSPGLIYPIEKNYSYFLNIGNVYPLIMLGSYLLWETSKPAGRFKTGVLLFIIGAIIVGNMRLIAQHNQYGEVLFSVQQRTILSDEKKVLDYMYKEAQGRPFAVNTVTNPLFINTTWSFLFDWYGKRTYGYMPQWFGYPQVEVYGDHVKFEDITESEGKYLFLVIEPKPGIPDSYVKGYQLYEDGRSKLVETKKIGYFTVEKRIVTNYTYFSRDDLFNLIVEKRL